MRSSEPETFEAFVQARFPALLRTATLLSGSLQDGEDLIQTALVKAVGVWSRIEDSPEPYVRRILVNENISRWRRHRGREHLVGGTEDPLLDRPVSDASVDDQLDLADALTRLTRRQRTVLVLRFYEDLTERETAALMGVALGTVKSTTRDALTAIRRTSPGLVGPGSTGCAGSPVASGSAADAGG